MQSQIDELELHYKNDINRIKSKFQAEIDELRLRCDSLKKLKLELESHLKILQADIKDAQDRLIEEQTLHETTRDALNAAEKRNSSNLIPFNSTRYLFFVLHRCASWRNRRTSYNTRSCTLNSNDSSTLMI